MAGEIKFDVVADISKLEAQLRSLGIIDGRLVVSAAGATGNTSGGGGGGEAAGAVAGGAATGGLSFLKLLGPIAVGVGLIAAFFEAVGPILKIVSKLLSAVILILLMPFLQLFLPLLKSGIPLLINTALAISDGIKALFNAFKLPDAIEKLASGDVGGFVIDIIQGGLATLAGIGGVIFEQLQMIVTDSMNALVGLGTWIWEGLVSIFTAAWDLLSGFAEWYWETLTTFWLGVFTFLAGAGKWIWDTWTGIISAEIQFLVGFGTWLWDTITGVFNDLPDKIGQAISGIAEKIKEGANFFLQLIFGGINGVIGFLKGVAIPSPFGTIKPFGFLNLLAVPKLETGGYVAQTGMALVHKGESVIPAGAKGMGGGVNIYQTNNFSGTMGRDEIKREIERSNNQLLARIRQMTSTGGRLHVA